jgi:methylmalonyl-CoA mutase
LTEQDPYNNVVRTAFEAMSAVLGGTQSLHTNSFDEAIALPTEFSARIARNTQLILQNETGVTDVVDPLAGSYYVESLTQSLVDKAWSMLEEIDAEGGMTQAIAKGIPKMEIEKAAALRQARVDKGEDVIVGVNKFTLEEEDLIDILEIDNAAVRESQVKRINEVRASRNEEACQAALTELKLAALSGEGNLLRLSVEAARARATLGEISDAMEAAFGRHKPTTRVIKGVYSEAYSGDPVYQNVSEKIAEYKEKSNKTPHVLIAKMGQDGHDRGAKVVATAFADLGFDVDLTDLFSTPEETALLAIEKGVDAIGVSSLAAGHKTLIPELVAQLKDKGREDIKIFAGGVIPEQDYAFLRSHGVSEIFGPGTNVLEAAYAVLADIAGLKRNR